MGRKELDLTGRRFGRLVVIGRAEAFVQTGGHALWRCVCDCNAAHLVRGTNLTQGKITRCRRCALQNIDPTATETVVRIWCKQSGEEGGYAIAVDDLEHVLAHSPWTMKKLDQPLIRCSPLLWVMDKLVELGRVSPRKPREPMAHWCQRTGVTVAPRLFTSTAAMHGVWLDATGEWRGQEDGLRMPPGVQAIQQGSSPSAP
jgi:hypothetical protein